MTTGCNSLVVISHSGVESDFFGSFRTTHDVEHAHEDDFEILINGDVPDEVDVADISAEDVRSIILFPAGHPGYSQF